jgi:uncharacterized Zn finger protein (UPF0148 family)
MTATFCRLCGANLFPDSKFCANCGKPIYEAPTTTQETDYVDLSRYVAKPAAQPAYQQQEYQRQQQEYYQQGYQTPQSVAQTTYPQQEYYQPPLAAQPQPTRVAQTVYAPYRPDRKNPALAGVLALIILPLGHFYIGKWWRGLGFMAAAFILFWLTIWMFGAGVIIVWIAAPIDAYNQAKERNRRYGYPD